MVRRSTPQAKIDERAFPVRIFLPVPPRGFGTMLNDMHRWLGEHTGRGNYALHGAGTLSSFPDSVAIYVRHPRDAVALLDAFPSLTLADGTERPGYTSPTFPFGRK